jgi:hypothetical protein
MSNKALQDLEDQLRGPVPPGVAQLPAEHLHHLADAVRSARRRQADELQAAGDKALNVIPRLLRGPIRKIVG